MTYPFGTAVDGTAIRAPRADSAVHYPPMYGTRADEAQTLSAEPTNNLVSSAQQTKLSSLASLTRRASACCWRGTYGSTRRSAGCRTGCSSRGPARACSSSGSSRRTRSHRRLPRTRSRCRPRPRCRSLTWCRSSCRRGRGSSRSRRCRCSCGCRRRGRRRTPTACGYVVHTQAWCQSGFKARERREHTQILLDAAGCRCRRSCPRRSPKAYRSLRSVSLRTRHSRHC